MSDEKVRPSPTDAPAGWLTEKEIAHAENTLMNTFGGPGAVWPVTGLSSLEHMHRLCSMALAALKTQDHGEKLKLAISVTANEAIRAVAVEIDHSGNEQACLAGLLRAMDQTGRDQIYASLQAALPSTDRQKEKPR